MRSCSRELLFDSRICFPLRVKHPQLSIIAGGYFHCVRLKCWAWSKTGNIKTETTIQHFISPAQCPSLDGNRFPNSTSTLIWFCCYLCSTARLFKTTKIFNGKKFFVSKKKSGLRGRGVSCTSRIGHKRVPGKEKNSGALKLIHGIRVSILRFFFFSKSEIFDRLKWAKFGETGSSTRPIMIGPSQG